MKQQRDETLFRFFEQELAALVADYQAGAIDLWFGDESGFHLNPHGVYAWQAPHSDRILPAQRKTAVNILGFITLDNQGEFYDFEANMTSELFIACVEDFIAKRQKKKTILVIDKSSTHYSKAVQEKCKVWKEKQFFVQFLPSYSSELNYIEILWKRIKHQWLDIADWISTQTLKDKVLDMLKKFGQEYKINFEI